MVSFRGVKSKVNYFLIITVHAWKVLTYPLGHLTVIKVKTYFLPSLLFLGITRSQAYIYKANCWQRIFIVWYQLSLLLVYNGVFGESKMLYSYGIFLIIIIITMA